MAGSHRIPSCRVPTVSPFYRCANWGIESLSNPFPLTQLLSGRTHILTQRVGKNWNSTVHTLLCGTAHPLHSKTPKISSEWLLGGRAELPVAPKDRVDRLRFSCQAPRSSAGPGKSPAVAQLKNTLQIIPYIWRPWQNLKGRWELFNSVQVHTHTHRNMAIVITQLCNCRCFSLRSILFTTFRILYHSNKSRKKCGSLRNKSIQ